MPDRPEENLKLDIKVAQKVMGWYHEDEAKWPDMEAWWFDNPEFKGEPKYLPYFSMELTPAHLILKRIKQLGLEIPFAKLLSYRMVGANDWDTQEDVAALLELTEREAVAHIGYGNLFNLINAGAVQICQTALRIVEWSKSQSA